MSTYSQDFERDGFCIISQAIEPCLINKANEQIDSFRAKNDALLLQNDLLVNGMLQRVVNLQYSVSALRDIFIEAMNAGRDIVDIYGPATLYTSLFFELGSQQVLHRDTPYFFSGGKEGYMGVWVALDDADEENGALIAVKGSHKLPDPDLAKLKTRFHPDEDVPASSTPLFNAYNEELVKAVEATGLTPSVCNVKSGDMLIWNPSTLHGGLPHNNKARSRRSFVMHITPKDMPMKHMDYFFHRDKVIEAVKKPYVPVGDRLMSMGNTIDFRHKKTFDVSELGEF